MSGRAAVATFSVLAGCGGGPPSAQPAPDAGPQPVCVDVALTPTVLGDEGDWSWLSNPIVGGLAQLATESACAAPPGCSG
ncbi:MAG: hypothetical protein KF718_28825 [Polyangiaceae bacterium]|nr:hypothetical protein [Polyangiaceae bacterium]